MLIRLSPYYLIKVLPKEIKDVGQGRLGGSAQGRSVWERIHDLVGVFCREYVKDEQRVKNLWENDEHKRYSKVE